MDETFYIISRGYEGKALTTAQRNSSLFSEEPVVLGKVLRRGGKPMRLTPAEYEANKDRLLALEKAGAIKIQSPTTGVLVHAPVAAPPPSPEMTEEQRALAQAALDQQRAETEAAARKALEVDELARQEAAAKALEDKKNEEAAQEAAVPVVESAPEAPAPVAAEPAVEAPTEPVSEVAPKHEKKSHSSKKSKG